jgi:tyrosyl-tRNA synthetase
MEEIEKMEKEMQDEKLNPRDAKLRLAGEIVAIYHGEDDAREAREYFVNTFSKKEIPDEIQAVPSPAPKISIIDYMIEAKLADSKSDARRKVEQGGVSVNGEKINSVDFMLDSELDYGKVIKVGKRNFVKFE